jgi:flagellar basal body P-ring formation protein FlgA
VKKHRFLITALGLLGMAAATHGAGNTTLASGPVAAGQPAPWAQRVEQLALQAAQAAIAGIPGARVEVQSGQLDPRLKLAPCDQVDIYLPTGHRAWGATRVGIRCISGPARWNVFMPLTVRVFAPAVQTTGALAAGTVLGAAHVQIQASEWSAVDSAAFARSETVLGRSLSRALPAGATIRENDLKKRQWFAVGDVVKVLAVGNGFSVASEGVALTHGFEGEPARIKTENGRTVTGTVTGERRVQVAL